MTTNTPDSIETFDHRTTREYHRYLVAKFGDETARGALRRYLENRREKLSGDDVAYIHAVLNEAVEVER